MLQVPSSAVMSAGEVGADPPCVFRPEILLFIGQLVVPDMEHPPDFLGYPAQCQVPYRRDRAGPGSPGRRWPGGSGRASYSGDAVLRRNKGGWRRPVGDVFGEWRATAVQRCPGDHLPKAACLQARQPQNFASVTTAAILVKADALHKFSYRHRNLGFIRFNLGIVP